MSPAVAAAEAGRVRAESLMTDACTIARPTTAPVTDPVSGAVTYPETTIYTGRCRARPAGGGHQVEAGEDITQVFGLRVSVPISVTGVRADDVVTVTASADGSLVGKRLRVREIERGSHITARRLRCEETS